MLAWWWLACGQEAGFSARPDIDSEDLRLRPELIELPEACPAEDAVLTLVVDNADVRPAAVTGLRLPPEWFTSLRLPASVPANGSVGIPVRGPVLPTGSYPFVVQTEAIDLESVVDMRLNEPPQVRLLHPQRLEVGADPTTLYAQVEDDELPDRPMPVTLFTNRQGGVGTSETDALGQVQWRWDGAERAAGLHRVVAVPEDQCGQKASAEMEICQRALGPSDDLPLFSWSLHGDADYDDETQELVLVRARSFQRGSAFDETQEVQANDVHVDFRFWIGGGSGADGISLTVLDLDQASSFLGGEGGGIGFSGLPGWSVAVDVWHNDGVDPTESDHVAFHLNGDLSPIVWAPLPEMENNGWHDMSVHVAGGHLNVIIDGETYLDTPIPQVSPFRGILGFTAATGGSTNEHRVSAPLVEIGDCPTE